MFIGIEALGWESNPEYQTLTEVEPRSFEGPGDTGPEYQSDIVTYMKPSQWQGVWLSKDVAFDSAYGSTGGTYFFADHRAKIQKRLIDAVEVKFLYFDESHRERETVHFIVEVTTWFTKFLGFSVYGEPTKYKRNDDLGLALTYRPEERKEVRAFFTAADFIRSTRNDLDDRFVEPNVPYSLGFVGRMWDPAQGQHTPEFWEIAFRRETPALWNFPTAQYLYNYHKTFASVHGAWNWDEWVQLSVRAQWDKKYEGRSPYGSSTETTQDWKTERAQIQVRAFWPSFLGGPTELLGGLGYSFRGWSTNEGNTYWNDLIPHLMWNVPTFGNEDFRFWVNAGYDVTIFSGRSDGGLWGLTSAGDTQGHHRFNFGFHLRFKKDNEIRLLGSFDLDDLGRVGKMTWEGGAMQMRFYL